MRTKSRTFVSIAIIVLIGAALMASDSGANAAAQQQEYLVFVSNSGDDTVSVIDFTTRQVTDTIDVSSAGARGAARPLGMASEGDTVFVALQRANALAVIVSDVGVVQTNAANSKPTNVAYDQKNEGDSVMVVLQSPASIMLQTQVGPGGSTACDVKKPWALAYTPDSSTIAVAGKGGVDLIDSADFPTRVAAAADVTGRQARDVAFAPDGKEGAFTDFKAHELVRFNPATGAVISRTAMKKGPWGVRYSPTEKGRLAVALNKKNKVLCVTTEPSVDWTATKVAKGPTYLRFTPDGEHIVVVNNKASSVTVLSAIDCSVESVIAVGKKPWDLTILEQ